jgi:hypothetical protein
MPVSELFADRTVTKKQLRSLMDHWHPRFRSTDLRTSPAVRFQGDLDCLYLRSKPRDQGSLSFHLRLLRPDLFLLCLDLLLLFFRGFE